MSRTESRVPTPWRARGFTLIEVMTVVAVLAVFAAIALPSFGRYVADAELQSASGELQSFLSAARADALTRRISTKVAPSGMATWNLTESGTVTRTYSLPASVSAVSSVASGIEFLPDGTATAATLTLTSSRTTTRYVLQANAGGHVSATRSAS